jgi:AcrR family transcriptional regulator
MTRARKTSEDVAFRNRLMEGVIDQLVRGRDPIVAEICKNLGGSPALVQYHFGSRANLISQAWESIVLSSIDEDFKRLDQIGQVADWNALEALFSEIFSNERSAVRRAHLRAIAESDSDDRLARVVTAAQEKTFQLWRTLLIKYVDEGVLKPTVSTDALALMFMGVPLGVSGIKSELSAQEQQDVSKAWMSMLESVLRWRE